MRLHLLGVPHTITRNDFSHCAFTGKVLRFSRMMRPHGFHVIHYGNEGSESGANEEVTILSQDELLSTLGVSDLHERPQRQVGEDADCSNPTYQQFNMYLRSELLDRLAPGDLILEPLGNAHDQALRQLPPLMHGDVMKMESGIGYPDPKALLRVYESDAWRHWCLGREGREGIAFASPRREWVVPNYYDLNEWPPVEQLDADAQRTVVFFGRIGEPKGCGLLPALAAQRPDLRFVMCGQGDPTPYLGPPNLEYRPPLRGTERAAFLGNAAVALFPSRFIEPFCGAAVEAMLCGTPVVTSDFGAFTETVIEGLTGYRASGRPTDWLARIDKAMLLSRSAVAASARARFSLEAVGSRYATVFREVEELLDGK